MSAAKDDLVDRVLLAVELVPSGAVVSYGDLAELCDTSARRVGAIMRDHGHEVAWWRVCSSSGDHPLIAEARQYWDAEGIILKSNGRGCAITHFRTDLAALASAHAQAVAHAGRRLSQS